MKTSAILTRILSLAVLTTITGTVYSVPIPGFFNTGVDDLGNKLPLHSVDSHYSVSGQADVVRVVPRVLNGPGSWVLPPSGSAWVGPNPDLSDDDWQDDALGVYNYTFTFDLTGWDVTKVQVGGFWATDNTGELFLNGNDTGFSKNMYGFLTLEQFLLSTGFVEGINTIEFRVENVLPSGPQNPSGLLVAGLFGAFDENISGSLPSPLPPDPEDNSIPDAGSTLLLFGCALSLVSSLSLNPRPLADAPSDKR